jgi:hypothetical protein
MTDLKKNVSPFFQIQLMKNKLHAAIKEIKAAPMVANVDGSPKLRTLKVRRMNRPLENIVISCRSPQITLENLLQYFILVRWIFGVSVYLPAESHLTLR